MYEIPLGPVAHRDPWLLGLGDRLRLFHRRSIRVAYFSSRPNNSSFRYRVFAMAQIINESDIEVGASWFYQSDGAVLDEVFRTADVVVVHRSEYTARLEELIRSAQARSIPVLYDSDDLVFEPRLIPLLLNTLNQPLPDDEREPIWMVWFSMIGRQRATLELCDGFIGSTESLIEHARPLGLPVHHVPNFPTREQQTYSDALVTSRRDAGNRRDGRIHVGYFSGTPTHVKDLAIASDGLSRLAAKYPEVVIRLVGYMTPEEAGLEGMGSQIEQVPFTDYLNLQRVIAETEISVAPLQANAFTHCKSELKWFDAAAVAIPTLVSPTKSMTSAVTDGVDGIVVRNHEWFTTLEELVENDLGQEIGTRAYESVTERYAPSRNLSAVLNALSLPQGGSM